eukprot:ANDGO_02306.mRNA.1 hypothetical protein
MIRSSPYRAFMYSNISTRSVGMQVLFVVTGVGTTMGTQLVSRLGAADDRTAFVQFANYIGYILIMYLPASWFSAMQKNPNSSSSIVAFGGGSPRSRVLDNNGEKYSPMPTDAEDPSMAAHSHSRSHGHSDLDVNQPSSNGLLSSGFHSLEHTRHLIVKYWWELFVSIALDFGGQTCCALAIANAGSSLFQVGYSSIILFTAVFSRIALNRRLSQQQWVACGTIVFGLTISAYQTSLLPADTLDKVFFGMVMTFSTAAAYGANYVSTEWMLEKSTRDGLDSQLSGLINGVVGMCVCLLHIVLFTLPNWNAHVTQPVDLAGSFVWTSLLGYVIIISSSLFHNYAFYEIVTQSGSITIGLLQAIRAVSVFFVSHLLLCGPGPDAVYCMSFMKALSAVIVISGMYLFSTSANER